MTFDEALKAIEDGKRVRSPTISQGWVVKLQGGSSDCEGHSVVEHPSDPNAGMACELCPAELRVVHEATGSSFACLWKPEHQAADWQIVEGWA